MELYEYLLWGYSVMHLLDYKQNVGYPANNRGSTLLLSLSNFKNGRKTKEMLPAWKVVWLAYMLRKFLVKIFHFRGEELLLYLTVNLWFVSWWGFCCSINRFFYFEKLHRHTLNRERHINVQPFWGQEGRKWSTVSSFGSFLPSFPCGFTLFSPQLAFP